MALVPVGVFLVVLVLSLAFKPWLLATFGAGAVENLVIVLYGFGIVSLLVGVVADTMHQYEADYGPRARNNRRDSGRCQTAFEGRRRAEW